MKNNYPTIINYFNRRSTNAGAESFNAKVKAFRSQFRGVGIFLFSYLGLIKYLDKSHAPTTITA